MQDQFVGDLGDYPKFGLLHSLAGMSDGQPPLKPSVVSGP